MAKMGDIYRSPGRDCKNCGGDGEVTEGTKAHPQKKPCPVCNPDKQKVAFI